MKGKTGGKRHGGSGNAPTIRDPRFSALHSDPRFQKLPRNKLKLEVDKRFQRMFTDKEFLDPFSVDKRGRPKKKRKEKRTLERYYRLGEDEDVNGEETQDDEEKEQGMSVPEEPKQEVSLEVQDEEEEEGEEFSSSEPDASGTSSESEASTSDAEPEEEQDPEEEEEKVATTETETRRIAVVNMDWAHIKAADLLVLFNSFLPKGGRVESVTVYPSQFGLEQMKREEMEGPQIFKDDDPDDEDGAAINQQKLREYERLKLRYYFAVVVCDSVSTASFLYNACDGTEFERTSNILDLRFVPDDMQLEVEPRDTATDVPQDYDAPEFCTAALQHSKVKLTWDDDEAVRVKQLRRKFNAEELENMDFKTYLASDDDEEEDDDDEEEGKKQDKIMKYKSLLLGDDDDENSKKSSKHNIDMEVTFPSGLEELSKKFSEQKQKKADGEETVWEAYLRKKKEKKKGKQQQEAADQKQVDKKSAAQDDEFNDPFFNPDHDGEAGTASDADEDGEQLQQRESRRVLSSEERQKKREERLQRKRDEENRKAELELLFMDDRAAAEGDGGGVKGFNLKKQKKKERGRKKKGKDEPDAQAEELFTKTNYDDLRFQSLFTSADFAVDPTNPQFKRSAAKLRAVAELQQRRFKRRTDDQEGATDGSNKQKAELSSLVRSVKRKVAK